MVKLSIKTLKGEIFHIEADGADRVAALKEKIQAQRSELGADRQKLIHSGKVLKDEQTVEELKLSEADFLVCMVTKEVAKKPTTTPAPAAAPVAATPATTTTTSTAITATPAPAPAPARPAPSSSVPISNEAVQALMSMGYPEAEVRAALAAAMGNPNLAFEFLNTGIPEGIAAAPAAATSTPASTQQGSVGIEALRQHPQFNMLKQLVQQNPAALAQVLDLIGSQNPALLAAIHANNEAFLAMMNEPITNDPPPATTTPAARPASAPLSAMPGAMPGAGGGNPFNDPAQMIGLLAALPPAQRAQFAQTLGMSPEQLEGFMQMMSSIPPQELQQILQNAGGATGAGGRDPPGVIRLTEEEMAAVNRLVALGFSQQEAAQAYLACDKNEALAANLLFEGGWGGDEDDAGGFGDGGDNEGGAGGW